MSNLPSMIPSAANNVILVHKVPESNTAGMSMHDRLKALEKRATAYEDDFRRLEQGVQQFGKEVDEVGERARKFEQGVQKLEADVRKESAAWDNTEQLVGEAVGALAVVAAVSRRTPASNERSVAANSHRSQSKYRCPGSDTRRTHGRQ